MLGFTSNVTRTVRIKKTRISKQTKGIAKLQALPDKKTDTSDIRELRDWSGAHVGKFYRPIKEPVTIRLDADVLAWLKSEGRGYQTRINYFLRQAMLLSNIRRRRRKPRRKVSLVSDLCPYSGAALLNLN